MVRRKTHEDFFAEINDLYNGKLAVIGRYQTAKTSIEFKCNICDKPFERTPDSVLRGHTCECIKPHKNRKVSKLTEVEVKERLKEHHGGVFTLVSKFTRLHDNHLVNCVKCGYTWPCYLNALLHREEGKGCPLCAGNAKSSTKEFKHKVITLEGTDYEVLSEYKNAHTHLQMLHTTCGREFPIAPNNFISGGRCPHCAASKGEKRVAKWLMMYGITFESQFKIYYDESRLPLKLDFLVYGTQNIAIEYDGMQHFKPIDHFGGEEGFLDTQRRDAIKDKYCVDNGIPLIRIPYWDFDNIDAILTGKLLPIIQIKYNADSTLNKAC